ncbi:hypothetical protein FACS1894191_6260 [Clostridia bacterium]|nr:hypothetical protein FACS1894191_6260 [Clostridia bacterium]
MNPDDRVKKYLRNILQFLNEIKTDKEGLFSSLEPSHTQSLKLVAMDLIQIGENVNRVMRKSPELLEKETKIPWGSIIGFRNIAVHDYDGIDEEVVRKIITHNLDPLEEAIKRIV